MKADELAEKLNGVEYGGITTKYEKMALKNGLVIVYGASDDLMEFSGAIYHEAGAWDGVNIAITEERILEDPENFDSYKNRIKAIWNDNGIPWTYETEIPHETFDIMKGEYVYCRGIVFSMKDVCEDEEAVFVWGTRIKTHK